MRKMIILILISLIFASCKNSLFLQRKCTSGVYKEKHKKIVTSFSVYKEQRNTAINSSLPNLKYRDFHCGPQKENAVALRDKRASSLSYFQLKPRRLIPFYNFSKTATSEYFKGSKENVSFRPKSKEISLGFKITGVICLTLCLLLFVFILLDFLIPGLMLLSVYGFFYFYLLLGPNLNLKRFAVWLGIVSIAIPVLFFAYIILFGGGFGP